MERLRASMAQDVNLYPDVNQIRNAHKHRSQKPQSVVSVSSTSSSVASVQSAPHAKPKNRAIVISDSEDDSPQPLRPQESNVQRNAGPSKPKPSIPTQRPPVPIHVPSNMDLNRPQQLQRTHTEPFLPTHQADHAQMHRTASNYDQDQDEVIDTSQADQIAEGFMSQSEAQKALQDLVADAYAHEEEEIDQKDAIVEGFAEGIKLLPHQILGRKWMAEREVGKKTGGILADDMGLGKTIQTLVRIWEGMPSKKEQKDYSKTNLVICPVAVVGQWASEIKKMVPGLTVIEHHGQSRTTDPEVLKKAHVVITSYSTVASEHGAFSPSAKDESKSKKSKKASNDSGSDISDDSVVGKSLKAKSRTVKKKDVLFRVRFWRVVLDEAHNIKNRNTKAALACCDLVAKYRWCLTGTPMQNNVEELYSLFKFLRLKPLSDWPTFKSQVAQPIKSGRVVRAMKRLQFVLSAVMLRRTKTTILNGKPLLDLPDRLVNNVFCEFDATEKAFYGSIQERIQESVRKLQEQSNVKNTYTSILVLLLRLRQACNHPSLICEDYKKDQEAMDPKPVGEDDDTDELVDLMGTMGLAQKTCQVCRAVLTLSNTGKADNCKDCDDLVNKASRESAVASDSDLPPDSAKTRKIMELLDEIDERSKSQEKTIIFSQFTSMLSLIEPFLESRGTRFVRYDGSMTKPKREEALEKIRTSKRTRVILISFKAGSTGLNLTCCNNVILVDLWWNPALEDQAFDRAHRLGQTRDVNIYKLSIPGTVEERILELQEKKRALANAALSGDKIKNMRLGMDDLIALFGNGGADEEED